MKVFSELRRRNVFRMAALYVVVAWLVMQVAGVLRDLANLPEWVGPLVLALLAIGLPIALVLSWFYELTPEGVNLDSDVEARAETEAGGRRIDFIVIALLASGLMLFAYDKWWTGPLSEKSIAVLPFANMSGDPAQDYFADGISEELLSVLAHMPEIRVISRTSAFSYKGRNAALTDIADELNVGHILDGSVRRSGDRVRITAQLIHAQSDTQVWTNTFDRQLDDIFAIQDEIAAAVVDQLKVQVIGARPRLRETSPEAYALYLQGQHLARQLTGDHLLESNELFQRALALDPDYAPAWTGIANNYIFLFSFGLMPFDDGARLAREAIEVALAIDPQLAHAFALRGRIAKEYENDLPTAAWNFKRALELDLTDDDTIRDAAWLLIALGRIDEAIELTEFVIERDPVNPFGWSSLGAVYHYAGRWDAAIDACRTALRFAGDFITAHYCIGEALLYSGDAQAALAAFQAETLDALRLTGSAMAYQALGRFDESDAALAELINKHAEGWAAQISIVYDYRNEPDKAFGWLEKAVEYRDPGMSQILPSTQYFSNLRDDSRWLPFLESIGYAPQQLTAIEFDVTLPTTSR